jgi:hypothetical protein
MERIIFIISLPFMLLGWNYSPGFSGDKDSVTEEQVWHIDEAKKIER